MTVVSIAQLKNVKNAVIGNPSAKRNFAQDVQFLRLCIEALNSNLDIRIEAAHIISSLSYGSPQAVSSLLRAGARQALLFAISQFKSTDPPPLRAAFARALRALTVSLAELIGPHQWGLPPDYSKISVRNEAKNALDSLFQTDSLDIYLPLLSSTSAPGSSIQSPSSTVTSIAQLLASGVRTDAHRTAVTEWLPPSERAKETRSNSSRRWEKASATSANPSAKYGGWVAMTLSGLTGSKDVKLQEAALYALANLAKDNQTVAVALAKHAPDKEATPILSTILQLSKSKITEIKLAASLCVTHIYRASCPVTPSTLSNYLNDSCENTIMHIMARMLNVHADEYTTQHRTRACYILHYLVHDDQSLCLSASNHGCLASLAALIREITPPEAVEEWGEDEAESLSALREATFILTASLSLLSQEIRRCVADELNLLPFAKSSLRHKHYGVRYAACQCIRALSRSVQALRTNLVDTGVGLAVMKIVMQGYVVNRDRLVRVVREGEIEEDRRVLGAALTVVCNCVNDFSPLRTVYLSHGLLLRLVQFVEVDDDLRRDALWAIKNLLTKTSLDEKKVVMHALSWTKLIELLDHPDSRIQEQAFNIVRNLAENEDGIDLVFQEVGVDVALDRVRAGLESAEDDVTQQAACALANLVNGSDASQINNSSRMLTVLHTCLTDRKTDIRKPICSIVSELARTGGPEGRKALTDEGFPGTLKRIVEWSGPVPVYVGSPTGTSSGGLSSSAGSGGSPQVQYGVSGMRGRVPSPMRYHHRIDEDKKLTELARLALDWLEYSGSV